MERIGEYLIRRLVGEGGMGKVYEAEERLSQRRVALKVLRPDLTRTEEGRRLFLNEMKIMAQLEHPNVVRSLASLEIDGQLVLVLEFLEGRTLRTELIDRGRLPWPEAVQVVSEIAAALSVAHAAKPSIVHRDLKPENVMRTAGGGLKVMDFGIAKVLEAAHITNTHSVGTLQYMSPEQIDARAIDARSDLYALGLLFYEMLAGAPPFRSASPRELLNLQCTAPTPELPDEARAGLPRAAESLLFDLLAKLPEERPATADEVVRRLAPFVPARPSPVPPAPEAARRAPAEEEASPPEETAAEELPRSSARDGDTLHSTPPRRSSQPPAPKAPDPPVRLAARPIRTSLALLVIAVLSLVAGLAAYVLRLRMNGPNDPAAASSAAGIDPVLPTGSPPRR